MVVLDLEREPTVHPAGTRRPGKSPLPMNLHPAYAALFELDTPVLEADHDIKATCQLQDSEPQHARQQDGALSPEVAHPRRKSFDRVRPSPPQQSRPGTASIAVPINESIEDCVGRTSRAHSSILRPSRTSYPQQPHLSSSAQSNTANIPAPFVNRRNPSPPHNQSDSDSDSDSKRGFRAQAGATLEPPQFIRPPPLPFRHTRLFQIRTLYPNMAIEMHPFSVDSMPNYVAISHRWGSEQASTLVACNDSYLMLKPSLVACIENVSLHAGLNTWYWVDGICIDQEDEQDKAQQVKMLWKLFGDAETVVMYLGDADYHSDLAIKEIRDAAQLRLRDIGDHEWYAVKALVRRPWFSRLWTMQEAILARNLLIVCGQESIPWQDLAYVHDFVRHGIPSGIHVEALNAPSVASIITLRRWRAEHGETDSQYCRQILHMMVKQNCFLQVDRVYAVLGLFPPAVMAKIDVNYSYERRKEYWTTYENFCRALVNFLGRDSGPVMNALRSIRAKGETCPGNVPSWLPDFSRPCEGDPEDDVMSEEQKRDPASVFRHFRRSRAAQEQ